MRIAAAILAAGSSSRAGFDKTLVDLAGRPVWRWSFETYSSQPQIQDVFVVGSQANFQTIAAEGVRVVLGGSTRQESVRKALESVSADVLLLHDAGRPFVSGRVIGDVVAAIERSGAAAAAVPVVDTIKEIMPEGVKTLDRSRLIAMQTPQGARVELLRRAHHLATADATDDMALLEHIGVQPEIVLGDPKNFKITTAEDLERARAAAGVIASETRIGFGYDVHPFSSDEARTLMLGGVAFPGHPALDGHSDADVLLHAATDALLGAAGLGDIGQHFPNTEPRWKGEPSLTFLKAAANLLREARWTVVNLDITVVAESPKIGPKALEIISCIASALELAKDRVSVKATTNEKLGFIGRGEGIAATAACCIRRSN
jgi:2-C-methyl-D-erythritol 4-phosphate cytidylyltransferase/2-C-methyl-D-erythritol 2,4-cyclodiphosphate synthase